MSDTGFIQAICENASRFPEQPAVLHKGQAVTYAALIAGAKKIAYAISATQVGGSKIVVINFPNSIRLVEYLLGCLIARVSFALAMSEADALAVVNAVPNAFVINERSSIEQQEVGCFRLPGASSELFPVASPSNAADRGSEVEPVVIFNTSGTSGEQKSVAHTYGALNLLSLELSHRLRYDSRDRSLVCMSMLLPFCLTSQILPALFSGSTLVVKDCYEANDVLHSITHEGITRINLHGRSYIELAALCNERMENQLRSCIAGAELCPPSINRAFGKRFGLNVIQSMGMSETLAHSLNTNEDPRKIGSAGLPLCGATIRIEDADGRTMPHGEVGEIAIETPLFMRSLSGLESDSAGRPFRTGDLGYVDDDGYLWFVGRKSSRNNVRLLLEVQRLNDELFGIDGVADAFVQSNHQSELVAFICIKPGHSKESVSNEIVKLVGNRRLAINYLAALPKLPTGKMDTGRLTQMANHSC